MGATRWVWLFLSSRRNRTMFAEIEADLEATMLTSAKSHADEMGTVVPFERPLPPTFEELELAVEAQAV